MKRYILSDPARFDLDDIAEFISRDSPVYALGMVRKLRQAMRIIAASPGMGRACPDLQPDNIRVWSGVHPYLIYYRPQKGSVVIVRVVHGARDQERVMVSMR